MVKNVEAARAAGIRQEQRRSIHLIGAPWERRLPFHNEYVCIDSNGRQHFPISVGASLSDFEAIPERYPMYRCGLIQTVANPALVMTAQVHHGLAHDPFDRSGQDNKLLFWRIFSDNQLHGGRWWSRGDDTEPENSSD